MTLVANRLNRLVLADVIASRTVAVGDQLAWRVVRGPSDRAVVRILSAVYDELNPPNLAA